ncbi:uncharacterized protein LOC119453813 isoform X2 [Dermacentor silvarum]|nr:uncharacterized protein LOC119453813 isoform X2 [Dermacentor silvarum]
MALVCTVAEDIWGVPRGRCGECECDGFRRTVELISHERVPLGWSILCGHSPVAHGALTASYGMHRGTHEVAPPLARGEMFAAAAQPMAAAELEPHTSAEVSAPTTSPSTSSNLQHTTVTGSYSTTPDVISDLSTSALVPAPIMSQPQLHVSAPLPANLPARGQTLAYKQWNKECIPQFSSYLNPFLNGHDLPVKTRQHMKAQLRDEIITFLNENNLINSPSTAVRRWQYDAFGSTLAETFPEMQFEARGPGKKIADLNFGWKAFMRSVSATRKTRMLRMKKVSDKPAESDHTSSNPIPCPDALLELKTIEDMVTDPFCMDLGRMKMLLAATAEARSSNAPDDLPSYFLNPDVLAFEAEIRFRETVEAVAAKLRKMQEILDRGSLIGLEEFVRPKKADAAVFMTAQELGNRSPPGPCILKENGNFKIAWKKNIVALPPASSPEKAVILLLTVYFILNLSYPYAFGQFLGLVQTVVKGEPFDSGLMSFKVKSLFKNLKQSGLILTC